MVYDVDRTIYVAEIQPTLLVGTIEETNLARLGPHDPNGTKTPISRQQLSTSIGKARAKGQSRAISLLTYVVLHVCTDTYVCTACNMAVTNKRTDQEPKPSG